VARRARAAAILAAMGLFFAGNLYIMSRPIPVYLKEAAAGKTPALSSTTAGDAP